MTTIFVPTSGTQTDTSVFETALSLARPLDAHLQFYHLRLTTIEAAVRAPHVDFCVGGALTDALDFLERRDKTLSAEAGQRFRDFCASHRIPIREAPGPQSLSARWLEETNDSLQRLLFHARYADLIVLGRRHNDDLMPVNFMQNLLVESGRPIVIAPDSWGERAIRTIVVGWKETPGSARALTAAMPLLAQAERVVLIAVRETGDAGPEGVDHLARRLAWSGIAAEARILQDSASPVSTQLIDAAIEFHADLMVVGGFGHRPVREQLFGGVTQDLLNGAPLPVLLVH